MKIKNKKNFLSVAILSVGLFFGAQITLSYAANIDPASESKCIASGGTSFTLGRCYGCSSAGKVTGCGQGAVCQTKEDYDICVGDSNNIAASAHPEIEAGSGSIYNRPLTTSKKFNYTLLESFPGFFAAGSTLTDLPKLILSIYKFGIWTVGIAGLFMLVVGGFMYMASAGNTSTAGNARSIIWDSLIGIVAALGAYLILYVINPDLTRINLNFTPVEVKFEQMDASNPKGSTACLDCISVADICKESPCSLNSILAGKLRAALIGQNARITEGWPATVNHSSSCHGNGTCADVNLKINQGNVQEVKKLYDAIRSAGLNPVYEDTATGCAKYTEAGVYCKSYSTMTYPSFHVNL